LSGGGFFSKAPFFPLYLRYPVGSYSLAPSSRSMSKHEAYCFQMYSKLTSHKMPIISSWFTLFLPLPMDVISVSCNRADILAFVIVIPPCFFSCKICYINCTVYTEWKLHVPWGPVETLFVVVALWPKTRNFHYAGITQIHPAHFGNAMQRLLVQVQKVQTALCRSNITRYCCLDSYLRPPPPRTLKDFIIQCMELGWQGGWCLYLFSLCIWGAQIISCHPC